MTLLRCAAGLHRLVVPLLAAAFLLGAWMPGSMQAREMPGMPSVSLAELPSEALRTLELIRRGGPFPYRKDGTVFQNRERRLPGRPRGYYTEYTVRTPGERDRGARRIVAGAGPDGDPATSGEYYYTDDHYRSFRRIRQ
jgi:ribonuclease T1